MRICTFKLLIFANIIFISLASEFGIASTGMSQARSMGMGDAYTCLAFGAEAPNWNPANLSITTEKMYSVNLLAIGGFLKNSVFSQKDYQSYNGEYLDSDQKQKIFGQIPHNGLTINGRVDAQILSFGYNSMALSISSNVSAKTKVGREIFNLVMFGNQVDKEYDFLPIKGDGIAYSTLSFAFGYPLPTNISWLSQAGVGVTAKYLRGTKYLKVINSKATSLTEIAGAQFQGNVLLRQSDGGNGFGLDLGFVGTINHQYRVGLVFENIPSIIYWNTRTKETKAFFKGDSLTVEKIQNVDVDSVITRVDSVYNIGAFSAGLPTVLRLGVARNFGNFLFSWDYEQGFLNTSLSETIPQFAMGVEWRKLTWLRIRSGLTFGGHASYSFSWGFGFVSNPIYCDLAIRTYNGLIVPWVKGIAASFSLRFLF